MAGELLLDTAALVLVLDRSQVHQERLTTDRRDFRVYRVCGRRSFKIVAEIAALKNSSSRFNRAFRIPSQGFWKP